MKSLRGRRSEGIPNRMLSPNEGQKYLLSLRGVMAVAVPQNEEISERRKNGLGSCSSSKNKLSKYWEHTQQGKRPRKSFLMRFQPLHCQSRGQAIKRKEVERSKKDRPFITKMMTLPLA